ncbi:MAG: lysoplasmalogenase [Flavobacteriales bacterium]|nr:lysoplasmalogenase [Flavobacteriales bacterium]
MQNRIIYFLFFSISCIEIAAEYFNIIPLIYFAKPLLMPTLMFYVICNVDGEEFKKLKVQLLAALLFSFLGDTLLMFSSKNELFFLLGLSMFLIAHVFYILLFFFHRKVIVNRARTIFYFIVIVSYYCLLMFLIYPKLGDFSVPVYLYGLVLCTMLFSSFISGFEKVKSIVVIGAILFVFSDSLIALNKFYLVESSIFIQPSIMLLYALGQFCIVLGLTKFLGKSRI